MVRRHYWSWFFHLPILCRFDGFCLTPYDIVIRPSCKNNKTLIGHELNHVYWWRIHWFTFPLSYVLYGYKNNPFERLANEGIPWRGTLERLYPET